MKRQIVLLVTFILCLLHAEAQVARSKEFHEKYQLKEVVIFSRHNIRAPLATPGSFINEITPYEWHDFGVNSSNLTMKGGVLETINGQFFHQWVVSEGLFPENAEPAADEILILSNSMQRTISTARHFASSFMPMQTLKVNHEGNIDDMDPNFSQILGDDITEEQWEQIAAETAAINPPEKIRQISEELEPNFRLLESVLDIENSKAYKSGTFTGFNDNDATIVYTLGKEPTLSASLEDASLAADAVVLQYYEEPDPSKNAFGKTLTKEQWQMLNKLNNVRDEIRFSSPFVQHYVTNRLRHLIADELQHEGRKFTFLCGHDTNILNILNALHVKPYKIHSAIENRTPIGSKIVFEKWVDSTGNEYVAVNHTYQSEEQLRTNTMLNLSVTPCIIPLQFDGLETNSDGLYPIDAMLKQLTSESEPTSVAAHVSRLMTHDSAIYNLTGQKADPSYKGILIMNGKKVLK